MSLLRTIVLHGHLAKKYGKEHHLAVETPLEAVHALCVLHEGFRETIADGDWRIFRGDLADEEGLPLELLSLNLGKKSTVHIMPAAHVSGLDPISWVIIGVVLVASIALTVALMPSMKAPDPNERKDDKNSFIFDGPVNVTEQGHPVPLVYGEMRVGSIVVSAAVDTASLSDSDATDGGGSGKAGNTGAGASTGTVAYTPGVGDDTNVYGSDLHVYNSPSVHLQKGGKGGGGGQSAAKEDPNTLQSQATARIVELISEGEIVGLVNGLKSVYLDDTPVQNTDNSFNFKGITLSERIGLPDQDWIEGFPNATSLNATQDIEVTVLGGGAIATIINSDVTRAKVTIRLNALWKQDTSTGDLLKSSVSLKIQAQSNNGGFVDVHNYTFNGKCTSPYHKTFIVSLPPGGHPFQIKVTRVTPDRTTSNYSDTFFLDHIAEIVQGKLTYPDSAIMAVTVDAKQFGSSIPTRSYHIKGIIVEVPTNYDPATRTYATTGVGTSGGAWDGTFKRAWTDNPAWIFRDININKRYGIGKRVDTTKVDKWTLYRAAKYNDDLVPNGKGGFEPRYRLNCVINTRRQAYEVLAAIASNMRAMVYWSTNSVTLAQDAPAEPSKLITVANTINEEVVYSGADLLEMYSAVAVSWNDPNDGYRLSPEVVEDPELLRLFGWRVKQIVAYGSTSQGQARRIGRWFLEDQKFGSDVATYKAGMDHADAAPGKIVAIEDPEFNGKRWGGRLIGPNTTTQVVLDAAVILDAGKSYRFRVILPDGRVSDRRVTTGASTTATLSVQALPAAPLVDAVWEIREASSVQRTLAAITAKTLQFTVSTTLTAGLQYTVIFSLPDGSTATRNISSPAGTYTPGSSISFAPALETLPNNSTEVDLLWSAIQARQWRIVTVQESDGVKFSVRAKSHDPGKYARVEDNLKLDEISFTNLPSGPLEIPGALSHLAFVKRQGTAQIIAGTFSWETALDARITNYQAQIRRPGSNQYENLEEGPAISREVDNITSGVHTFRVRGLDNLGRRSAWSSKDFTLAGPGDNMPEVTGLALGTSTSSQPIIKWNKPVDFRDFEYAIYVNSTNTMTGATFKAKTKNLQFVVAESGFFFVKTQFQEFQSPLPPSINIIYNPATGGATVGAEIGVNLTNAGATPTATQLLNTAITVNADGTLTNAGGGQVTRLGLGDRGNLTLIGTNSSLNGNNLTKLTGTHAVYEGGAVGQPMAGSAVISCKPPQTGGWSCTLALDDDPTSFAVAQQVWSIYFIFSTGTGHAFYLYRDGAQVAVATGIAGTADSIALIYDGTAIKCIVNAAVVINYTTSIPLGAIYYPKAINYHTSVTGAYSNILYGNYGIRPQAGTTLVNSAGTILNDVDISNSAITIGANGTLSNAGGGAVTFAGIAPTQEMFLASLDMVEIAQSFDYANAAAFQKVWQNYLGSGEITFGTDATVPGGKYVRIGNNLGDDMGWYIWKGEPLPYDSAALYEVTFVVRGVLGVGTSYLGVAGIAADKVTLVNSGGLADYTSQHYVANAGGALPAAWTVYKGYIKGFAATGSVAVASDPATPGVAHTGVRYLAPLFLVNYSSAAGQADVAFVRLRRVDPTRLGSSLLNSSGAVIGDLAVLNSSITLNANGTINNAGGGGVTIGGLGYGGDLNATRNRVAWQSGDPGAVEDGYLWGDITDGTTPTYKIRQGGLWRSAATYGARSGSTLVDSTSAVLSDAAIRNSAVTMSAAGVLGGAGGGTVTIGGLGYAGDLNATRNRVAWQSLDPGAVEDGYLWGDITDGTTPTYKVRQGGVWRNAATYGARSGSTLVDSTSVVLSDAAIRNSAVTLSAAGALGGAGGGAIAYDSLPDGTTYKRTLASRLNANRPFIDFSESFNLNKNVDNVADGTTYARPLATELTSGQHRLGIQGSGYRLGGVRNMPAIAGAGLRYRYSQNPTYSAPVAGTPATSTISIAAGNLTLGSQVIAYNAMSVNVTGTNSTTSVYNLYMDNPAMDGGAQTLVATTSTVVPYEADGRIFMGQVSITYPASGTGTGGGGTGGGGGGLECVWIEAWVDSARGLIRAQDVKVGDLLRVLSEDGETTEWEPVTLIGFTLQDAWEVKSESGHVLWASDTTPLTLRDGSAITMAELDGHELPVYDEELRWERCSATRLPNQILVNHISVSGRTYAAGNERGKSILTHNAQVIKQ